MKKPIFSLNNRVYDFPGPQLDLNPYRSNSSDLLCKLKDREEEKEREIDIDTKGTLVLPKEPSKVGPCVRTGFGSYKNCVFCK